MSPRTPLFHPRRYFEERVDATIPGLAVFSAYVVATAIVLYGIVDVLFDQATNVPPAARDAVNRILPTTVVILVVFSIIGLLVVALVMHVFSSSNDRGSYKKAIAVAGWAYAPNALATPITYLLARREIRQLSLDGSDPEVFQSQLEAAQNSGSSWLSILVLVGVVAWSVYILAYGIAATHHTTVDRTIIPAAVVGIGAFVLGL